jgi:hypothetical protein
MGRHLWISSQNLQALHFFAAAKFEKGPEKTVKPPPSPIAEDLHLDVVQLPKHADEVAHGPGQSVSAPHDHLVEPPLPSLE